VQWNGGAKRGQRRIKGCDVHEKVLGEEGPSGTAAKKHFCINLDREKSKSENEV